MAKESMNQRVLNSSLSRQFLQTRVFLCLVLPEQLQRFLVEPKKRMRALGVDSLNYFQFFIGHRTANRVY